MKKVFLLIAVIFSTMCLGGCGIGRAAAFTLLTSEVAPPDSTRTSLDINTVMIDDVASSNASYGSKKSAPEIIAYYIHSMPFHGYQLHPVEDKLWAGPDGKAYHAERLGIHLIITVETQPKSKTPGNLAGTTVWIYMSMDYPWDMFGCRIVQGLARGLTGMKDDDRSLMFVGMF